ncbi:MAG: quaternary ammonium compound efflux SMR transporter SugE [Devosiaceae bacterium]|nr:quaternary ammonium compound efflux SMR transporter SugE [Devosiaceae bacterium]
MAWVYLMVAAVFEMGWAIGLKYTDGFSRFWPSTITIVAMIVSFQFLAMAMKTIPVGTAYAVWTGTGAVGVSILGIMLFGESRELARILSIMLIVAGVIGLKIFSTQQ